MNLKRHIKKFRSFHEQYILNPKDPNEKDPKDPKKKKTPPPLPIPDDLEIKDPEDEDEDTDEKDLLDEIKEYFKQKNFKM